MNILFEWSRRRLLNRQRRQLDVGWVISRSSPYIDAREIEHRASGFRNYLPFTEYLRSIDEAIVKISARRLARAECPGLELGYEDPAIVVRTLPTGEMYCSTRSQVCRLDSRQITSELAAVIVPGYPERPLVLQTRCPAVNVDQLVNQLDTKLDLPELFRRCTKQKYELPGSVRITRPVHIDNPATPEHL
jgi:hypothetical protein